MDWLALLNLSDREGSVRVVSEPGNGGPRIVEAAGCTLLFSGTLANGVLNDDDAFSGDEGRVLSAYLREGKALFPRLRGRFAIVLLDRRDGVAFVLRDPMGSHPLFYAVAGETLYFSPVAEILARRDGQKPQLNRLAGAAFLLRAEFDGEETFFVGVRRLLQGHMIEAHGDRVETGRYWLPHGGVSSYRVDAFHALLRQAVDRLVDGRTGVFLSGGLDSALVAAVLADLSRSRGLPPPVALSLAFGQTEADAEEQRMQREVAERLGLEHVIRTPAELVGPRGVLEATLELARSPLSLPPELLMAPYDELARVGSSRGCTTILGGTGGDEWLLPPPGYAADRLLSFDTRALTQLCRAWAGYWPGHQPFSAVRGVLWRSGLRAAGRSVLFSVADRFAPALPIRIRRTRAEARIPEWVAPDGDLRRDFLTATLAQTAPHPPGAAVDAQKLVLLDAQNLSVAQETAFGLEARAGAASLSPLLDPDVVELLYRLPVRELIGGGRAKAPARDVLSRYFLDRANSWPRTVYGNSFWRDTIRCEGGRAWATSGGTPLLAEVGLVDSERLQGVLTDAAGPISLYNRTASWRALSLESWLRGVRDRSDHL